MSVKFAKQIHFYFKLYAHLLNQTFLCFLVKRSGGVLRQSWKFSFRVSTMGIVVY